MRKVANLAGQLSRRKLYIVLNIEPQKQKSAQSRSRKRVRASLAELIRESGRRPYLEQDSINFHTASHSFREESGIT